jgi:hypothetical protein
LTNKPFAVNLFANSIHEEEDIDSFEAMKSFIAKFAADNNIPYPDGRINQLKLYSYHEQIEYL